MKKLPVVAAAAAALLTVTGGTLSAAVAGSATTPARVPAATVVRVSVNSAEVQGNDISGRFSRPATDATGETVAFDSIASNLVRTDTNHVGDIFVRDVSTGRTTLVSQSSTRVRGNGESARPDISADGRFVVFDSASTNWFAGDHNGTFDVFVRDLATGTTSLVSQTAAGKPGNSGSFGASISSNGRYVAFTSDATHLTKQPVTGARDIFVRDLKTGRTTVASIGQDGNADGIAANSPSISRNGRYVAFSSFGTKLVDGDTNDTFDIFVRDRLLGTTTRVSVDSQAGQADGESDAPAISADGSRVAFSSIATNLVAGDTNGTRDIFVHDLGTGATTRVSVGPGGVQADGQSDGPGIRGGLSFGPDISDNGRFVTFDSIATNLVRHDTDTCDFDLGGGSFPLPGQCPDIFVHDLTRGTTSRVSVTSDGAQSNGASTDPAISGDGHSVAFFTTASNLAADDTNTCQPFFDQPGQCPDIYLHSR